MKRILTALGLSPPEDEKPPPIREVVRVPVDDEGREIQATYKDSTDSTDGTFAILTLAPQRG